MDETNQDYYGLNCFLYIHQNPIRARIVNNMEDWPFSSFRNYAGMRSGQLCNQELASDLFKFPDDPKKFYQVSLNTIPPDVSKNLY